MLVSGRGRYTSLVLALIFTIGLPVLDAPASAAPEVPAAPDSPAAPADPVDNQDGEGGDKELRDKLEAASAGFLDARDELAASKKRQVATSEKLRSVEGQLAVVTPIVNEIVSTAYQTGGGMQNMAILLGSDSPGRFVDRAAQLRIVATRNERQLRELARLRAEAATAKSAVDREVVKQERQLVVMARRKADAERALAEYGAGGQPEQAPAPPPAPPAPPKPIVNPPKPPPPPPPAPPKPPPPAQPAPGGSQACNQDDPTTNGCLTSRTLHALRQAQAAGFTRYVACFRRSSSGEHPKGRACDFAAQPGGFGGVATGGDRTYGNNLANYFIANAGPLQVLYVIWFRRIWLPSSGWRAYTRGQGDPSSDHTNHVHLSVR
jgi:peptidoglycan DL-endopeptidase CwlO